MDVKRIAEMEAYLDECAAATAELTAQLDRMDGLKEKMSRVFGYYGSREWYEDLEEPLPPGLKAGVLSQDGIYDAITDIRDAAIHMLELGTDILKNRL